MEFIAFQIQSTKRHNNFLTFLKRAIFVFTKLKASKFKGIKILISGRFNNAPRAKTRLLQFGRIPLQTMDAQIDYYKTDEEYIRKVSTGISNAFKIQIQHLWKRIVGG